MMQQIAFLVLRHREVAPDGLCRNDTVEMLRFNRIKPVSEVSVWRISIRHCVVSQDVGKGYNHTKV